MSLIMRGGISSTIMKTMRTLSATVTSPVHTSSTFQAKTKTTETKTKKKMSSSLKTKEPVEARPPLALCPIMVVEEHQALQKELGQDLLIDSLVSYILSKNIKVSKTSLMSNISVYRSHLSAILRKDLPKNLDAEIKVGRFTAKDDQIIKENWSLLLKHTKREPCGEENEANTEIFLKTGKGQGLKNNIVGYFLSQGLPNARLATEVFHRAKILLCAKKGDFSPEEDQIIIEFVEKEGRKWGALTKQLGRSPETIKGRYELLSNDYVSGKYSFEEDKTIFCELFNLNKNILVDKNISTEDWKRIGSKLGRNPDMVQLHWSNRLEPTLVRHHAGTLHKDVRKVLIEHLLENNIQFAQDAEWKKLAKLPKFVGATPRFLQQKYNIMRQCTRNKYPELSEDKLTTEEIYRWYNNSTRNSTEYKDAYYEKLVAFYLTDILQNVGDK